MSADDYFGVDEDEDEDEYEDEDRDECERCRGDGMDPWMDCLMTCPMCNGDGWIG